MFNLKNAYLRRYKNHSALSFARFISSRITFKSKRTFSKLIVRIAIVGIMLGLGVMILSLAVIKGFKQEIREKVRGFAGDVQIIKSDLNGSYENSPFVPGADLLKKLKANSHIVAINPYATKPGIMKANDEIESVVMKGVDSTYDWAYMKRALVAGSVIDYKDLSDQIMISQSTLIV